MAVWDEKIQQFNENGSKGSVQPARFLEGNGGQWIVQLRTRLDTLLARDAAQTELIKALATEKGLNADDLIARMGAKVEEAMAKVVQVQVSVEGGDA